MEKEAKKDNKALMIIIILISLFLIVFIIFYFQIKIFPSPAAPPIIPQQFYGITIFANNSVLPDSTEIYTVINGNFGANTTVADGRYGYNDFFFIENAVDGDNIEFYINYSGDGINIVNYSFSSSELTELNLIYGYCGDNYCSSSESCSSCDADCGGCSTPPSGGPSGDSCYDTCTSKGYQCGVQIICGVQTGCGSCQQGTCKNGKCVIENVTACYDTCTSKGYKCGTWTICGVQTGCGNCTEGVCENGICKENEETPESPAAINYKTLLIIGIIIALIAGILIIYLVLRSKKE